VNGHLRAGCSDGNRGPMKIHQSSSNGIQLLPKGAIASTFAFLGLLALLMIDFGTADRADASMDPAVCVSKNLAVSLLNATTGYSVFGPGALYLPIKITNTGATCSIGGVPRIRPIGVRTKSGTVLEVLPTSMKFKNFILKKSQSVYTILVYWRRPSGHGSFNKRWLKSCDPVKAMGFEITITPRRNLLNRKVNYTLPEVCTAGKANMLITPLNLTMP